jgi:hypothetical protein
LPSREHSDALDLKQGVFKQKDPKRPSTASGARTTPIAGNVHAHVVSQSLNRAGAQLREKEKTRLEEAKDVLRSLYDRPSSGRTTALERRVIMVCKQCSTTGDKRIDKT